MVLSSNLPRRWPADGLQLELVDRSDYHISPARRSKNGYTRFRWSDAKIDQGNRIPPGQHLEHDFPVLSAGPTPQIAISDWSFEIELGPKAMRKWSWTEFNSLPMTKVTRDIHCVTSWSKLDTPWEGVLFDDLLEVAGISAPSPFALAHSHDGYSINVPTADLLAGRALVALRFEGQPLESDHGGPARLLVSHLYLWKSAKWGKGCNSRNGKRPGFWERRGYHM